MKRKTGLRALSTLLAVMLVSVVVVSAVSAQDVTATLPAESGEPALVIGDSMNVLIAGATSVSDIRASGIPEPEELNIPKGITRYDLVTFDHVALNKQVRGVLPLRVHGKEYQAELHRMDFEQIDDGIDSYEGVIAGVDGSDVLLTTGENVLIGSVTFGNETFWIRPIEPRACVEQPETSLHIIYNSEDILYPQEPAQVDQGPVTPPEGYPTWQMVGGPEIGVTPAVEQYATINLLVVTDNQFYSNERDWKASAQDIIAEANRQYDRDDIRVALCVMAYDDSRRYQLSNNAYVLTNPLRAFWEVYPESDLDLWSSDLGLYLGGYDKTTGYGQGAAYGFTNRGRHAWAQMVQDDLFYQGTDHGRKYVAIHEIGHNLDANHEGTNTTIYNQAYDWWDLGLYHRTVMWSGYLEPCTLLEFSSDDYHGDATHDNARSIREAKWQVAGYV